MTYKWKSSSPLWSVFRIENASVRPSYETHGSRTTPFGTIEKHFSRDRAVVADRHLAELRAHPIVAAAFAKNGVRQVIGHGEHGLAIAEHEMFGVNELTRVAIKHLQPLVTPHFTRSKIQAFPGGVVTGLLAVHEKGEVFFQPVDGDARGFQFGENLANHGLFDLARIRGDEALTPFQAVILINPIALEAGYRIRDGVSILDILLGVFLAEGGRGQQNQDGARRQ